MLICSLLLLTHCIDEVSVTFLVLENNTTESAEVTFYGWSLKHDTTFALSPADRVVIDYYQTMGREDFLDFNWVLGHFDSLEIKTTTEQSSKNFKSQEEWVFIRKESSESEYALIVDQNDF